VNQNDNVLVVHQVSFRDGNDPDGLSLPEGDNDTSSSSASVVVVVVVVAIPVASINDTEEGHIPMVNPTTTRTPKSKISMRVCGCFHHGSKGVA